MSDDRGQERSAPLTGNQPADTASANERRGGRSLRLSLESVKALPRQRGMPSNQPGPQERRARADRESGSVLPQRARKEQAGSPIPVRCASPVPPPVVISTPANNGECNTLSQLSALSSSLEQLISAIREQSVT